MYSELSKTPGLESTKKSGFRIPCQADTESDFKIELGIILVQAEPGVGQVPQGPESSWINPGPESWTNSDPEVLRV